jgi:hypothetical protein
MVKKISFFILSAAILVSGYIGFNKLNYWERSARIFSINKNDQSFEGRIGRGPGGFRGRGDFGERDRSERPEGFREGFERPVMRDLPDSIRARFEAGGEFPGIRNRNTTDSLRQFRRTDRERIPFEGRMRTGEGRGRGDFPGYRKISLRNVLWFLPVFASFAVIVIYLDKAYYLIIRRRKRNSAGFTEGSQEQIKGQ